MSFKSSDLRATQRLADFVANVTVGATPEDVKAVASMALLDTIGIAIGGVAFERANNDTSLADYLDAVGVSGTATVIGDALRVPPLMAAFANGFRSEILDFQDTYLAGKVHCSSVVIPSVLAAGETAKASGADVLAAIIAGYEVGCRIAGAVMPDHARAGFQITGTYTTCAAAVAAGRALGWDTGRIAQALAISGFVIPASNADNVLNGHTVKPVHAGQAAMSGLSAALMAQSGFQAGPLEGEAPRYFAPLLILGCREPELSVIVEGLGIRWRSLDTSFKKAPAMLVNAGPVEAVLALRVGYGLSGDEIEAVEVYTFHDAYGLAGQSYTQPGCTYVHAQFSMPFCIAAALTDGELTQRQFLDTRLADERLHALAAKVTVHHDPDYSARFPGEWPVRVEVRLRSGNTVSKTVDIVDWSNHRPPGWQDIASKFAELTAPVLGDQAVSGIVEMVRDIESLEDIGALLKLTRPLDA